MRDPTFTATVRAALDPLLEPYGFAQGQGGDALAPEAAAWSLAWSSSDPLDGVVPQSEPSSGRLVVSLTFCAAFDDLPRRAQALAPQAEGHCVDIVVEGSTELGITEVAYEFRPLPDLLDDLGLAPEAARCRQAPSGDLRADVAAVHEGLARMLERLGGASG